MYDKRTGVKNVSTQGILFDRSGQPVDAEKFFREAAEKEQRERETEAARLAAEQAAAELRRQRERVRRYYDMVESILDVAASYAKARGFWRLVTSSSPTSWSASVARIFQGRFRGSQDLAEAHKDKLYKECVQDVQRYNQCCAEFDLAPVTDVKEWVSLAAKREFRKHCERQIAAGREELQLIPLYELGRKGR